MTKCLQDKVAVITGGASGIGLATVMRFLNEGAQVVIADLNEQTGALAMKQVSSAGFVERCQFFKGDVSSESDMAALMKMAVDTFGALDIAYLNAGVGGAFGSICDLEQDHWDETFAILVRSVFLGIKYAAEPMKARGGGSIIATSSVAGISGGAAGHPYSASKAAVVNLVRTTAIELAPFRIRVNSVAPGLISTPLVHRGDVTKIPPTNNQQQPWPDIGQPDDIAGVVAFLASRDAGFITGETIVVDGGATANGANLWAHNVFASGLSGMNRGNTGLKPTVNN
ncbi:MAG: SDR family oxidoreductase [Burkholderiaceae bacterium]